MSDAACSHAIGNLIDALNEYDERWNGPVGAFSGSARSLDYATKDDVLRELENVRALIEGDQR